MNNNTTAPITTSPSTEPTIDPVTGLEVPRILTNDTYRGHKLSVKPGEVETVSFYLNKTLVDDLNDMVEKLDAAKSNVENKANEDPQVAVPSSFSTAYDNASKAIATALEDVQDAVTRLRNIADAICQYGDGGWATPYSVLKHLNDFIYSSGGSGSSTGGGAGGSGDGGGSGGLAGDDTLEPTDDETTIPNVGTGGDETNESLNGLDEEIIISEIAGSNYNGSGSEVVVPSVDNLEDDNLESDSDVSGSALSGFSSFIVPGSNENDITVRKSASVLGAVGLVAAAAVALGAKVYHDKTDDENEFDTDSLDFGSSENVPTSSNKEMLKMKKEIFNIGGDK